MSPAERDEQTPQDAQHEGDRDEGAEGESERGDRYTQGGTTFGTDIGCCRHDTLLSEKCGAAPVFEVPAPRTFHIMQPMPVRIWSAFAFWSALSAA